MKKSKSSLTDFFFFLHEYSSSKYSQLSLNIDFTFKRVINPAPTKGNNRLRLLVPLQRQRSTQSLQLLSWLDFPLLKNVQI